MLKFPLPDAPVQRPPGAWDGDGVARSVVLAIEQDYRNGVKRAAGFAED